MRVLVLGQRGMLGRVVARHLLDRGHQITLGRRYEGTLELGDAEAVVNCAGVLKGTDGMFLANTLLPLHLAARLDGRLLIHPSTDCVFDGRRGWYSIRDAPDATDDYGLSKRLGEGCLAYPNVVVLRTSIVGTGGGLLGWFLRQPRTCQGWTDHRWNGITTLAWAELAGNILDGALGPGLHQPATDEAITKYDLLRLFGEIFDHPIEVRPIEAGRCDRTLEPTHVMAPLRTQLEALRAWA